MLSDKEYKNLYEILAVNSPSVVLNTMVLIYENISEHEENQSDGGDKLFIEKVRRLMDELSLLSFYWRKKRG